jgi:excisionase family DNA binding protein
MADLFTRLLTPSEVAEYLRVDEDVVHAMVADGSLSAFDVGGGVLVPGGSLREFVVGAWVRGVWKS